MKVAKAKGRLRGKAAQVSLATRNALLGPVLCQQLEETDPEHSWAAQE